MTESKDAQVLEVPLKVEPGSLSVSEIQGILNGVMKELKDPDSSASQAAAELGIAVESLQTSQPEKGFVLETFLLILAIKAAHGAATGVGMAAGKQFYDRVIQPKIDARAADGVRNVTIREEEN